MAHTWRHPSAHSFDRLSGRVRSGHICWLQKDCLTSDLVEAERTGRRARPPRLRAASVKLHRIDNEQLYHYYLGDPIEVLLLRENGDSELVVVGPNIVGGHMLQLYIPGNTFHTARVTGKRRWFLGASTEWPGVVQRDRYVEFGDIDRLAAKYPEAAADIRKFPVPAER